MLVGEPGIGKTALCEQLGAVVVEAGGRALVGHCYAEGSFRPPYQPFVEALDASNVRSGLSGRRPITVRVSSSGRSWTARTTTGHLEPYTLVRDQLFRAQGEGKSDRTRAIAAVASRA